MFCKEIANIDISEQKTAEYLPFAISENAPIPEALHVMNREKIDLLPVVGANGEYRGAITLRKLLQSLDALLNPALSGAFVAIESSPGEVVLSQLIHIFEANNARVLNLISQTGEDSEIILLKTDLEDATPVARSLARFDYEVIYCGKNGFVSEEMLINRANELIRYIEI
ncbi:MAG: CBS domain-containing protein [Dysgonamonadaceae bacterium]|nr:CBS domain-containing protein [Dysgonamonadaceae bacterium]